VPYAIWTCYGSVFEGDEMTILDPTTGKLVKIARPGPSLQTAFR
jgi:hypothetical protein